MLQGSISLSSMTLVSSLMVSRHPLPASGQLMVMFQEGSAIQPLSSRGQLTAAAVSVRKKLQSLEIGLDVVVALVVVEVVVVVVVDVVVEVVVLDVVVVAWVVVEVVGLNDVVEGG